MDHAPTVNPALTLSLTVGSHATERWHVFEENVCRGVARVILWIGIICTQKRPKTVPINEQAHACEHPEIWVAQKRALNLGSYKKGSANEKVLPYRNMTLGKLKF